MAGTAALAFAAMPANARNVSGRLISLLVGARHSIRIGTTVSGSSRPMPVLAETGQEFCIKISARMRGHNRVNEAMIAILPFAFSQSHPPTSSRPAKIFGAPGSSHAVTRSSSVPRRLFPNSARHVSTASPFAAALDAFKMEWNLNKMKLNDANVRSICNKCPLTPSLSPAGGEGGLWPGVGEFVSV
ncbi:MAG TPA: hypothetical protein VFY06_10410 [Verrucomicrobiae bacterium]|nr:hypothetical protein [Verrucomicrobiae bacterium]